MVMDIPEHSGIGLHGLLHLQADLRGVEGAVGVPDLIEELDAFNTSFFRYLFVGLTRCQALLDVVGAGTTENDDIEKGVCSQPVGTVDRHTSGLARSIEPRNNLVLAILVDG
jgi:hypothetical protein